MALILMAGPWPLVTAKWFLAAVSLAVSVQSGVHQLEGRAMGSSSHRRFEGIE